jgi:hypothetical protein
MELASTEPLASKLEFGVDLNASGNVPTAKARLLAHATRLHQKDASFQQANDLSSPTSALRLRYSPLVRQRVLTGVDMQILRWMTTAACRE